MRILVQDLEAKGIPVYSYVRPEHPTVIDYRSVQKFVNRSGCLLQWHSSQLVEIDNKVFAACVTYYVETAARNVYCYGASIPQFDWRRVVGCLKRGKEYMGVLGIYITQEEKQKLDAFTSLKGEKKSFIETVYSNNYFIQKEPEIEELFRMDIFDKIDILVDNYPSQKFYTYLAYLKNGAVFPKTNLIKGRNLRCDYSIEDYLSLALQGVYIKKSQFL